MQKTKNDDDPVRARLQTLHDQNGANLTAEIGVEDAKDPTSPLHALLEWDNEVAGHAYRLDQMRAIIRAQSFITQSDERIIVAPYYVKNPDTASGYTAVKALATDQDRARRAMVEECTRVRGVLERARNVARSLKLEGELDALLAGIAELRTRAEKEPA